MLVNHCYACIGLKLYSHSQKIMCLIRAFNIKDVAIAIKNINNFMKIRMSIDENTMESK